MKKLPPDMATALRWHLKSNIFPPLTETTIEWIIQACVQYKNGNIDFNTPLGDGNITFGEMIDDLKIQEYLMNQTVVS